jgi:hypothetical protein
VLTIIFPYIWEPPSNVIDYLVRGHQTLLIIILPFLAYIIGIILDAILTTLLGPLLAKIDDSFKNIPDNIKVDFQIHQGARPDVLEALVSFYQAMVFYRLMVASLFILLFVIAYKFYFSATLWIVICLIILSICLLFKKWLEAKITFNNYADYLKEYFSSSNIKPPSK